MFRIESYITSIILSYVDRYIKNFKRQDAQVSLWEGDGSLHNLDLDLEVLDQELNLPFSFVSGHIHELLIHVPWTRIGSEPVKITINTIECIMKLKPPGQDVGTKREKKKKSHTGEEYVTPPSYMKSLVNKIIFNLSVTCNNLILKYVEEDIVLSMNIKTLSLSTVNRNWEPEFSELSVAQLILRNLVNLSDVTICLDKRNASGRIESYLEPILYKCSLKIRISRTFPNPSSTSATTTRIGIYCDNFALSISEPQVPMLLRLFMLFQIVNNSPSVSSTPSQLSLEATTDDTGQGSDSEGQYESWSSWMWGFVPSILPLASEGTLIGVSEDLQTLHVGLYINSFMLDLKLVGDGKTWESLGKVQFENCFTEISKNSNEWTNIQIGVSFVAINPVPQFDNETYLSCGQINTTFLKNSLFENPDTDFPQRAWDVHLSTITENYLVTRAPAISFDSLMALEVPMDSWSDNFLSEPRQKLLTRCVVGPLNINVTNGLIDRINIIMDSINAYDYPVYSSLGNSTQDLSTLVRGENKYFTDSYIPKKILQVTVCEANIRVYAAQIPLNEKKVKKTLNAELIKTFSAKQQPHLLFRLKCLDISLSRPLNPASLHGFSLKNTSMEIFSDAMTTLSAGVLKMSASVLVGETEIVDIVDIQKTTVTMAYDSVLLMEPESIAMHSTLQIGEVIFNSTKAKLLLSLEIIKSFVSPNLKTNSIYRSSLVHDSINITNVPFLKLSLIGLNGMFVRSQVNESLKLRFGSLNGHTFCFGKSGKPKFTVITSGNSTTTNVFEAIAQRPISTISPTPFILYLKLKNFHCNLDQSVFDWITYKPRPLSGGQQMKWDLNQCGSIRKVSSSSRSISTVSKPKPETADVAEKITDRETELHSSIEEFEKKVEWLMKWLGVVISADVTDLQFSFHTSLSRNKVLVLMLPSISVASSYGKLSVDSDELPVTFNAWIKNTPSFPWSADFNGITGYFVVDDKKKETILDPFSINCTIAVASKLIPSPSISISIHTDTSSIAVSLGRQQVSALAELLTSLNLVYSTVVAMSVETKKPEEHVPLEFGQESDESFSASNSHSNPQQSVANKSKEQSKDTLKVSCWLQWTLAKCTFALQTSHGRSSTDSLKLVFEMEDIIVSTDMDLNDRIYQKVKLKIGTAGIRHFGRESQNMPWVLGVYGGVVMKGHDSSGNTSEFLYLTFTRVLASNYHSKMSSLGHHSVKESVRQKLAPNTHYVMELDLKVEPLDFVLAPLVLGKFMTVIEPMIQRKAVSGAGAGAPLDQFTTSDLPLVYLDIQQIRAFVPSSYFPSEKKPQHDTLVFHIDDVALRHEAVNPVSRKILRSDIYSSAQRARVTTLPGSQLEDRQYQLDLTLQISTANWEDLAPHVSGEQSGVLDNPAVYWNSGGATTLHRGACLTPLLSTTKICFILAPPIVTCGFVISGLNFEANVISEIVLSLSLDQLRLLKALWYETMLILPETTDSTTTDSSNPAFVDSGIESIEGSVITNPTPQVKFERIYRRANSSLVTVSSSTAINTKNLRQRTQTVPTDLLVIGKGVTVKLYSTEQRTSKTQPLLYFSVSQPFISVEKHGDTCVYKASVFDLAVKHGFLKDFTNGKVEESDFNQVLIITKEGDPDPYKGIPPALCNLKSVRSGMKLPNISVEMGRPLKLTSSVASIEFLEATHLLILDTLDLNDCSSRMTSVEGLEAVKEKKDRQLMISSINFSTKQIALELVASSLVKKSALLSSSSLMGSVNFPSINQTYGTLTVESLVLSVCGRSSHVIVNPWTFTITGNLSWEPWISTPLFTVQLTSDILIVEHSPKHVASFLEIGSEFHPLIMKKRRDIGSVDTIPEVLDTCSTKSDDEDQYYKDDLQAGAFQFVNSDPQPDLPLAYQVVFPSAFHMAWAYPQPRSISSITVLPIPFDYQKPEGVSVSLQYLDFLGWKDWIKFQIYETKIVDVDLPNKPQVASTWRVIVKSPKPPIHVQSLAASLRVDSMFSPRLVPNVRLNVTLDSFQVSAWAGPSRVVKLPPPLSRFAPDNPLPGEYPFAKVSIEHIKLRVLSWVNGQLEIEGDFRGRADVVNCKTLQEQCVVQPFPAHVNFESDPPTITSPKYTLSVTAGPILAYISPSVGHTIAAAHSNAILMPVVLCNDTCFPVRIGQAGTNENIIIQCLQCHFYAWRTTQQDMELRFSLSTTDDKNWSRPVCTRSAGSFHLVLIDDSGRSVSLIIVVKQLSSTMTQVLISGELIVHNNLERSIDVRLVADTITERQRYVTVNPTSRAPSIVLSPETKYNVRLGLESQWSGLVPLFATSNSWLVKVPSKDKKDFISVWCQIFKEKQPLHRRMLVVISPMYLIKSLLPCDANVLIKTEELNVDKSLRVPGRGCVSNLITPGTTAHNHSLTFHIDGNLPSSSPHVPLSYSAMDGRTPPLPPIPDVEALIDRSESSSSSVLWPFLGPQWSNVVWRHANQPDTITHVQVRFCGDKLKVANSLMVELHPWALIINTLGLNIALQSTGRFLCALQHFCVLAPPPVEGTFYLLVELNDGYHKSNGLQLSDSQSFYKPQISGLIPLSDSVQVKVQAPNSVIFSTVHSKIMSGIRILQISSSYVIANLCDLDISVAAFSIRKDSVKFRVPSEILYYAVHLPKNSSNKIFGEPLAEWHELGYGGETARRLYLIFEHSGLISNPVPVTVGVERGTATALLPVSTGSQVNLCLEVVFQTKDNVVYITVDRQSSPQLLIHNRTRHLLTVAKSSSEQGGSAIDESEDWEWRFMLPAGKCGHYKIDVPSVSASLPPVVVARPDQNHWSTAISLVPSSGSRLVNLPQGQDLTATVLKIGYTIHLILAHANHSLISASDVRSRLSINSQQDLLKRTNGGESNEERSESAKNMDDKCEDFEKLKESVLSRFDVTCFLHGITLMLCAEPEGSFQWQEVAALTVDNVGITANPIRDPDSGVSEIAMRITVWDLQVDNQEFHRGGYDFSVVLLRQGEMDRSIFSGNNPQNLVETARTYSPAVDMCLLLNPNIQPVFQEVTVKVSPLQVYLEDVYLTKVKKHLVDLIPTLLIKGNGKSLKRNVSPSKTSITSKATDSSNEKKDVSTSGGGASKAECKVDDEEDLFNVSDEEIESPLSYSPWKVADHHQKFYHDRENYEEERFEVLWCEDTEDDPVYKIPIPDEVVRGTYDLSRPLKLKKFLIAPMDVSVSVHTSTKFYIALDQSPLSFSEFRRTDIVTNPYRLGHALTLHYFLGAIYGTGWALGSLQLLGAPAGLARSVGHGLRSFVTLPYLGIMEGPTGFLLGIVHGSASLMKHVTAGTLSSVNKLAGSWSRTLDRLTLSPDDLRYAEEMRRIKPQGIADGIKQGLTEFGVSLLGGVGGLAQQPLEYATGSQGQSFVGSLGRGLVGVMARPISGAAELVALTAHGILSGAGWADNHIPKHLPVWQSVHHGTESRVKYEHKLVPKGQTLLFVCEATSSEFEPVVIVITSSLLYVLNRDDVITRQIKLQDISWSKDKFDPTMVKITVQSPDVVAEKISQKRITEFVRESQRALSSTAPEDSFPQVTSSFPPTPPSAELDPLKFYLNPQRRDHFTCILDLATRHAASRGFPVLT